MFAALCTGEGDDAKNADDAYGADDADEVDDEFGSS